MSRNNNNYQQIQEVASSIPTSAENLLRTQQKNIVCTDCGGISAAKIQELLSTLEGNTQLFNPQNNKIHSFPPQRLSKTSKSSSSSNRINSKKSSMRNNNNQKTSSNRRSSLSLKHTIKKTKRNVQRRLHSTKTMNKQRQISNTKKRISLSSRNNNKSKSQNNKKSSIKRTRSK